MPQTSQETRGRASFEKFAHHVRSSLLVPPRASRIRGVESPQHREDPMDALSLDRLGDEIAELSAHLDAATARLLDLIREFDAREGWGNGFTSCAARLRWRVGLDPGAAREGVGGGGGRGALA